MPKRSKFPERKQKRRDEAEARRIAHNEGRCNNPFCLRKRMKGETHVDQVVAKDQ